jgi:hypothetical protein
MERATYWHVHTAGLAVKVATRMVIETSSSGNRTNMARNIGKSPIHFRAIQNQTQIYG